VHAARIQLDHAVAVREAPAISASRTSAPSLVIIPNACWTHVTGPPFLKRLPLADETTTGFTVRGAITAGAWPKTTCGEVAATAAAAPVLTNSRRFTLGLMAHLSETCRIPLLDDLLLLEAPQCRPNRRVRKL